MKVKKAYLSLFAELLSSTTPRFVEARFRDRFAKRVFEESELFDKERVTLCEALCEKGEDGKPKTQDGRYKFTEDAEKQFKLEYGILKDEEITFTLDRDEQRRLKMLVEGTNYVPKMGETELIDEHIISRILDKKKDDKATEPVSSDGEV